MTLRHRYRPMRGYIYVQNRTARGMPGDLGRSRRSGRGAAERGIERCVPIAPNRFGRPVAGSSMAELFRLWRARAELLPAGKLRPGVEPRWPSNAPGIDDH